MGVRRAGQDLSLPNFCFSSLTPRKIDVYSMLCFFHLELGNSLFGIRSKFPTIYSKLLFFIFFSSTLKQQKCNNELPLNNKQTKTMLSCSQNRCIYYCCRHNTIYSIYFSDINFTSLTIIQAFLMALLHLGLIFFLS